MRKNLNRVKIDVFPADLKKWFRKNPVTGALKGQALL
jgi:hypothetical protein